MVNDTVTAAVRASLAVCGLACALVLPLGAVQTQDGPATSGIYLEAAGTAPRALPVSRTMDVRTTGMAKMMLTQGFSKPKQVATHTGARADVAAPTAQPTFIFRFQSSKARQDPFAMMAEPDALPPTTTQPKDFTLARLAVESETRLLDTGKLQVTKFQAESVGPATFRVRLATPLEPGEYAFFLTDPGKGGGPATIWAFSWPGAGGRP